MNGSKPFEPGAASHVRLKRLVGSMALFYLSSCSWGINDRALMAGYLTFSAIDASQTSRISQAGLREANPLYAKPDGNPDMKRVIIAKLLGSGLIFWLLENHPGERGEALALANGIQGGVVVWNEYLLSKKEKDRARLRPPPYRLSSTENGAEFFKINLIPLNIPGIDY